MEFFVAAFLACFLCRASLPSAGVFAAIGAVVAALIAERRALVARLRAADRRSALAALFGLFAGCAPPAATPPPERPRAPSTDARAQVVQSEGTVGEDLSRPGEPPRFRLVGGPVVRVFDAPRAPLPGTRVRVVGRLDPDRGRIDVFAPGGVLPLAPPEPLSFAATTARCRRMVEDRLRRATPNDRTAGVLSAVMLGTPTLPSDLRDDLVRSGTLHLVAVSGSHLAIVLTGLRIATPRLLFLLPGLLAYAALVGFSPPVLRSLLLTAAAAIGRRAGARAPPGAHLGLAACVVLAVDPAALFDAGFRLSFAAYFGLLSATEPPAPEDPFRAVDARRRSVLRVCIRALKASAAAGLAAAPVTIFSFQQVSPLAPISTLVLAPLIPALLAVAALAVLRPEVAAAGRTADLLCASLDHLAYILARIPLSALDVARPHACAIGVLTAAVTSLLLGMRRGRIGPRSAAFALAAFALILVPDRAPTGFFVLDARRGSAALMLGQDGAVLVDTGPPEADVATQLLAMGVDRLDAVYVSHAHQDHAGGLERIRRRLKIGAVFASAADRARIGPRNTSPPTAPVTAGTTHRHGDVTAEISWPPDGFLPRDPNDRCLVVDLRISGLDALIPGDLEEPGLKAWLARTPPRHRDVLVLPHHGSDNRFLDRLLEATTPRFVAVSARAGFPSADSLAAPIRYGVRPAATFVSGTLAVPTRE